MRMMVDIGDTAARIKKSSKPGQNQIKFKIRAHRYLYTLILDDAKTDRADKLKQSLPPCMFDPLPS